MDKNVEIRPLASEPFDVVADAFMAAFAGYNIAFGRNQLADMMLRRGYRGELSFGAFSDGRLVSFIFNGIGMWQGALTAYDTGTGTVSEYRGLGLAERVFAHSLPALRRAGVSRYVLEVLCDNEAAIKVYRRLGFRIMRGFNCYSAVSVPAIGGADSGLAVRRVPVCDIAQLQEAFSDFAPSWQNDCTSFVRAGDHMLCLAAFTGDIPVGYIVAEPLYGDIAQIAVSPAMRRRGVATALLGELMALVGPREYRVVNVDTSCGSLNAFLLARGFRLTARQHEMMLPL